MQDPKVSMTDYAFCFMQQNYGISIEIKQWKDIRNGGNVHLVIQLSCIFKKLSKTKVNKENHTINLTKSMQYGLQW